MFTQQELDQIDRDYFEVIVANEYDVTLISNNTRHVWYLHNAEMPDKNVTIIFHKHHINHPYHQHGRAGTLSRAIKNIKAHDAFQLNGRKTVYA